MDLIRLCLARPIGVLVGAILTLLLGMLSFFAIPVQLTPTVDIPVVTVNTSWSGSTAAEVEREIVDRQEEQLRSVKGLREMTSSSGDGSAEIRLEFYTNVDKAEALRDVTDKLRQVTNYPVNIDEPTVRAADTARDSEIAWLILRATDGKDERIPELYDFTKNKIKPYLDRVKGVASTEIYGGRRREVQVRVDAALLASRGLTFDHVAKALQEQNTNVSAGTRAEGKRDYSVRTVGQYANVKEILDTVVAYAAGGPVYIRDIAEVEHTFEKQTSFVRSKGEYVLAFPVRREVGTNVIQVMSDLKAAVRKINADVLTPDTKLRIDQVYDETIYIYQAIRMVTESAIVGSVLTAGVLLVFLRNWRAAASVALAIPISVVGTFVFIVMLGRTLNVISLAGIAFAIGMVVDDSIVVLENIYRHREMGKRIMVACYDATREVWSAVLASTLTRLAVFLPVIFVQDEAGQLFRDISIATATSVGLSLIVAITVTPVLASKLLGIGAKAGNESTPDFGQKDEPTALGRVFGGIYSWISGFSTPLRIVAVAVVTLGCFAVVPLLAIKTTYLPTGNRNIVFGGLATPAGYSTEEFKRIAATIEAQFRPYWEAQVGTPRARELEEAWTRQVDAMIAANAIPELANKPSAFDLLGQLEYQRELREWKRPPPPLQDFFFGAFGGGAFMGATSQVDSRVKPLERLLTVSAQGIPGVFAGFSQQPLFPGGAGNDVDVQVRGDELDKVISGAGALFGEFIQRYGYPSPDPGNFAMGRPELQVEPDRERAADVGLSVADVGFILQACVDGAYVGDYRESGAEQVDIKLSVKGQRLQPTADIANVPIYSPRGQMVPLGSVVRMTNTTSLEKIKRVERQRAVTMTAKASATKTLESVIGEIRDDIVPRLRQSGAIDPNVIVTMTGNADKLKVARATMVGEWKGLSVQTLFNIFQSRFFLSVVVCYLLIVALYESWIYPFVIMFSVPLSVFGGFLGLFCCHVGTLMTTDQPVQQLDVLTFLGFVILVGTVVNNSILLVDQALQNLRDHGMSVSDAIRRSVATRTRPVLMTSMTTIFGQLPLVLIPGAGTELYRGLASVTVGGMLVSTLGTLVLVPMVLHIVMTLRESARQMLPATGGAGMAVAMRRER